MPQIKKMSSEDLMAFFYAMAAAPPSEANKLLARHLRCKQSIKLADAIRDAIERFPGSDPLVLPAPSSILPPLQ
jgi:hypothetical protein